MSQQLIGLSLSSCVKDMIQNKVQVEEVKGIVTNTLAETMAQWHELIENYCRNHWQENPQFAREICDYLLLTGRIKQPRIDNPSAGHYIGSNSHWRTEGLVYLG